MIFEEAYERFMNKHISEAKGQRKQRLMNGLGFAEKLFLKEVWWQAIGNFDYLYPEYMVRDFVDGFRFLDFAYVRMPYLIVFEIDGYGPHYKDMTQDQFTDERDRQNYLVMDGWIVYRFTVKKLRERPRDCQRQLQQIMGIHYGDEGLNARLTPQEQILVHRAGIYGDVFTPKDVSDWLDISTRQARTHLHRLIDKQHIEPASGEERIRAYKLTYRK